MCRDMNPRDMHPKAHLVITIKLHLLPSRMHKMALRVRRHLCLPLMPVADVQDVLMEVVVVGVPMAVVAQADVPVVAAVPAVDMVVVVMVIADVGTACLR